MKRYNFLIYILVALLGLASCSDDYLDKNPTDKIGGGDATKNTTNAWAALNGIHRGLYERYDYQGMGGIGAFYINVDIMGEDQVYNASQWHIGLYKWQSHVSQTSAYNEFPFKMFYKFIANANPLINGMDNAEGPEVDRKAIQGQALLYRAWCYHNLVQLYGGRYVKGTANDQLGVSLVLESSEEGIARSTVGKVYEQINADIDKAITLLDGYVRKNVSHLDLNVAYGLKARVALTMGEYETAANFAKKAQDGYSLMDANTYANGFRVDPNQECMWASVIQEDQTDKWANFGAYMSRNFSSSAIRGNPRSIYSVLYHQISDTDVRKKLWSEDGTHADLPSDVELLSIHKRFPYTSQKFIAPSNADSRVAVPNMRVAEMYLIEAEALARQTGKSSEAAKVLFNLVSTRDADYTESTKTGGDLIEEILLHRRIELWGEGFRWFDLKRLNLDLDRRTKTVNGIEVETNHKNSLTAGTFYKASGTDEWNWVIPKDEVDANDSYEKTN
ncbi:RagB/SusD family nutrient uptake outer membrane protein [Marinifilum sp. D737]|uniref:RagB/SusD family nutrient uptake outer membrane protein n=1 Tax=Marinifilum sp. D737 TaxID=2969628 RepID=UPI0022731440|nr:RagB/SusD family nutrient uptake outer membrane protein [Marinifilum sp. D737]MCY1633029.1 RagB/SusD family nutrient uptake outer membrane protein [Marinifilum sp. D737]